MAAKGKRRALYEMVDANDASAQSVPQTALRRQHMVPRPEPVPKVGRRAAGEVDAEPRMVPRPVREEGGFPLSPGRPVRIPVGYLFFIGAVVLGAIVVAFALGHGQGERAAALRLAQADAADGASDTSPGGADAGGIIEPLANGRRGDRARAGTSAGSAPSGGGSADRAAGRTDRRATAPAPTRSAGGALMVEAGSADPRTPGLNYIVVALRGPDEAVRIAEFLVANGIDAAVAPANRDSLRLVVALRGFSGEEVRQSNEFRRFRQNIRDLGREWAARNRGTQNFDDLYEARFAP